MPFTISIGNCHFHTGIGRLVRVRRLLSWGVIVEFVWPTINEQGKLFFTDRSNLE